MSARRSTSKKSSQPGQALNVEGHEIRITNPDKVLYPAAGFTKAHMIDYYIRIAPWLLPHFKDRPVTLKRFPDGIGGEAYYEKNAPGYKPEWVETFPVPRRSGESDICYILINDLATLIWCAQIASIELHPFLHRAPNLQQPTSVVFDLDPGEGVGILECCEVAFLLREKLQPLGLTIYPKVSGSKGIQIYAPLNTPADYADTQPFARAVAQAMERDHPTLIVSEMAKVARKNKVFIDWSQNSDFKTTVGVYSLRAKRPYPFASLPVRWEELETALKARDSAILYWQGPAALDRVSEKGDLFEPVLTAKQQLPPDFVKHLAAPATRTPAPRPLREYHRKRDFAVTSEPPAAAAALPRASRQGGRKRFVIQKHAASHLHYDFRLEMHGVLKSWAVPKGPPYKRGEKRLAAATEDHPLAYFDFEGIIPQGQYGGGTVMVWDIGTYELVEGNYYKGRLNLFLEGKKLKGEWLLIKDEKDSKNWRLIKSGEDMKPLTPRQDDKSALSGRTMQQITDARDAVWHSNRAPAVDVSSLPDSPLRFIEPMQAKLASALPEGEGWEYEIKLDGYRAEAIRNSSGAHLLSRRNNSLADRFPAIVKACEALPEGAIVDGEVVALDENGRPSFNLLQNFQTSRHPVIYYVFDILAWQGKSLLAMKLSERRQVLDTALAGVADPIRLLGTLHAAPADLIRAAREQGIEGFVAKRVNSSYEAGQRSGSWVKFKVNQGQELVIGGYMPGKNGFDSLLVGYYEGKRLIFIGKVKNGFTPLVKQQVSARFDGIGSGTCPFANLPEPKNARRGEALTPEVMKKCCWLKPKLVAQVEYTEWTAGNHLRHSKFVGLRDDKDASDVTHETAEAVA